MKKLLFSAVALAATALHADEGATISVTVTNIPGVKGDLLVGLYDSAKNFTKKPMKNSPVRTITSTDDITVTFEGVMPGTYAVAVIQDLNRNGKLDKAFGIPKEPLAFSVIKEIPRGKPKFDSCSFVVGEEDIALKIPLVVE